MYPWATYRLFVKVRSRMTHCSTSLWLDLWNTFGLKSNSIKQNEIFNFSIEASFELLMQQNTLFVIFWHQGHSRITTTFRFPRQNSSLFYALLTNCTQNLHWREGFGCTKELKLKLGRAGWGCSDWIWREEISFGGWLYAFCSTLCSFAKAIQPTLAL